MTPYKAKTLSYPGLAKMFSNFPSDLIRAPIGAWALSLVVDLGTNSPSIVGTAFPIEKGVLLTAKHVLPEFQNTTESTCLSRTLVALQRRPGRKSINWRIRNSIVHKTADLAVLFADPIGSDLDLWSPSWRVSRDAPRVGEWIGAFGNVDSNCRIAERHSNGGGVVEVGNEGRASFGLVNQLYPSHRDRMLPCPCFQAGAHIMSGMSGGPVFDERGEICGIVSTGFDGGAIAFIVTLRPSLSEIYRIN